MLNFITADNISFLLMHYGYFILFPIMVAEGPIATIIAGFLSSLGYFNFFVVYVVAFLGDITGDVIYYLIGRWGKKRIINNGKFLGIKLKNIEKIEEHFKNHSGKTLLFGKLTHSVGAPILIAAGMAKIKISKFIVYNVVGSIPKTLVFLLIGYYFGSAYNKIDKYFGYFSILMLVIIILAVVIYFYIKKNKEKINID